MRAPPPTSSFAHDSVAKHLALAESLGSTTSSSDIALLASFGEEHRERFDAVNTQLASRVRVLTQRARCSPFPSCNIFSTFACGFANEKYLAPVRPQCQLSTASAAPASCLDTDDGLIAPCECIGSARLVHRECLARWQKRKSHSSRTCEICKRKRCGSLAPWLVQLDVLDRE